MSEITESPPTDWTKAAKACSRCEKLNIDCEINPNVKNCRECTIRRAKDCECNTKKREYPKDRAKRSKKAKVNPKSGEWAKKLERQYENLELVVAKDETGAKILAKVANVLREIKEEMEKEE